MYLAENLLAVRRNDSVFTYVHNIDLFVRNRFVPKSTLREVDIEQSLYEYLTADDISIGELRSLLFPRTEVYTPLQAFSFDYELPDDYYEVLGAINEIHS